MSSLTKALQDPSLRFPPKVPVIFPDRDIPVIERIRLGRVEPLVLPQSIAVVAYMEGLEDLDLPLHKRVPTFDIESLRSHPLLGLIFWQVRPLEIGEYLAAQQFLATAFAGSMGYNLSWGCMREQAPYDGEIRMLGYAGEILNHWHHAKRVLADLQECAAPWFARVEPPAGVTLLPSHPHDFAFFELRAPLASAGALRAWLADTFMQTHLPNFLQYAQAHCMGGSAAEIWPQPERQSQAA